MADFSLRARLALAMSGMILLCTALCVLGAVVFLSRALTDRSTTELHTTMSGVSGYLETQKSDMLGIARLVAADPQVLSATLHGDNQALVLRLTPFYADLNADVLDVIDSHGRVIVRMENTLATGDNISSRPTVRAALAGQEVVAAESDLPNRQEAGGYALRAVVPIRVSLQVGSRVVGAVVVGRQLDSIFANRLGHSLNATINLIAGKDRTGSTVTDTHGLPVTGIPEPISILRRIATGKPSISTVHEDGHQALSGLVPLKGADGKPVGAVEVVRPLDPLYDLIKVLSLLLLVLGALVVTVGTLLALGIVRRLTSRLHGLEMTASHVADLAERNEPLGDLARDIPAGGSDEVASLARSVGSMIRALDARMETNQTLYTAASARVRELSGLAEIARLLTSVTSVEETMHTLGQEVTHLIGCEAVAIWRPGKDKVPALFGGYGLPEDYKDISGRLFVSAVECGMETTAQRALRTGELTHSSLLPDQRIQLPDDSRSAQDALIAFGFGGATAVPLHVQGKVVGAMTCYTRTDQRLSASDLSLLTTVADQVAVAVENARLAAEAQQRAALEERRQGEVALREKESQYRSIFESTSDGLVINDLETGKIVEANPAYCRMHGYTHDEIVHLEAMDVVRHDHHEDLGNLFVTIEAGGYVQIQGHNIRKDGTMFPVEVHGTGFTYDGKPHILAVVRDITERVEAYALLEQRVRERTHELSTLLDISYTMASTLELQPLLGLLLDQLKEVVDYTDAGILEVRGDELRAIGYRGPLAAAGASPSSGPVPDMRFPIDPRLPTWPVVRFRQDVIIDDVRGTSPQARAYRAAVGDQLDTSLAFVSSFMAVPMILSDRVIGALSFAHSEPNFFSERHAALARAIATQAAVAIENARLYEQAQDAAVLEERQRLARELHDSVSQALYGIALGARTARTLLDRDPNRVAEPLDYVLAQAEAGLTEMRALIFELRPEALEREGLVVALDKQAASVRARHGIAVEADLGEEPGVTFAIKEALYRIAQESMNNTVKHARARCVVLSLRWDGFTIELDVKDDGTGFDPTGAFPGHLGLRSMRERAARLGGILEIESSPAGGTRIRVRIPSSDTGSKPAQSVA